jgi:hypothetical protein
MPTWIIGRPIDPIERSSAIKAIFKLSAQSQRYPLKTPTSSPGKLEYRRLCTSAQFRRSFSSGGLALVTSSAGLGYWRPYRSVTVVFKDGCVALYILLHLMEMQEVSAWSKKNRARRRGGAAWDCYIKVRCLVTFLQMGVFLLVSMY